MSKLKEKVFQLFRGFSEGDTSPEMKGNPDWSGETMH